MHEDHRPRNEAGGQGADRHGYINFFDHADIYAGGEAERVFREAAGPALREKMMIQTKCAIRPGVCCDFSKEHIGESVDGSLKRLIDELAEKYHVTSSAIAVAWILRHPAKMQAIVGSASKQRIVDIAQASDVTLTREEWYALYMAAGKRLP